MVQVASAVLVCPVAGFTVEAWLSGTPAAGVLHHHGFVQVLLEFEVVVSPLHELGGFGEILLLPFERLFAWLGR